MPVNGQRGVLDWLKDPDRGNKPTDEWELLKLVKNPQVTVRMRGVSGEVQLLHPAHPGR